MKNKGFYIILIFVFSVILGLFFYIDNNNINNILGKSKYTIAIVSSERHTKSTNKSFGVDYQFYVDGISYSRQTSQNLSKGEKFLLIFDSLKPNNCRILVIYPIVDSVSAPVNGWTYDDIPIQINKGEIKEYIQKFK